MASRPKSLVGANMPTKASRYYGKASHNPDQSTHHRNPFGPAMAHEIFSVYDYGDDCAEVCVQNDYDEYEKAIDPDYEYWYQTELPLENVRQLEDRFRYQIRKFERSYHTMMIGALQWHYLLEEAEENPQIMKMFKDIQLMRKLSGSDRV